ncbi:MAG TPA: DUF1761 domain-containing protein [Burkholderiales bacterium]
MHPEIHINYLAVVTAAVASLIFGWLWHGPLFGKKWMSLMKMSTDCKPDPKIMMRGMGLTLIGTFLTAYVLAHSAEVWRPSVWGVGTDSPSYVYGFFSGFFTWIGFYVPMLLGSVAWESRSWSLFGLNAAYHFVNLQIIAMILAHWR